MILKSICVCWRTMNILTSTVPKVTTIGPADLALPGPMASILQGMGQNDFKLFLHGKNQCWYLLAEYNDPDSKCVQNSHYRAGWFWIDRPYGVHFAGNCKYCLAKAKSWLYDTIMSFDIVFEVLTATSFKVDSIGPAYCLATGPMVAILSDISVRA